MTARPGPGTPGLVVSATDHRRALGAFMAPGSSSDPLGTRSGIVHAPGNPLKVSQNSPLGMSALVQPGNTEIHRTGRGPYTPYNDAVATVTFDAAPASNSRYDLVYIAQSDSEVDGSSVSTLGVLKGAAVPSPGKPYDQLPAGGLVLAEVGPILSTTTAITDALIANVAPYAAVRGAPIPVRSQAERDALNAIASASYPITVERLDTGTLERNAGSGWVPLTGTQAGVLAFTAGWADYATDGTFAPVRVSKGADGRVTVTGLVKKVGTETGATMTVGTLPAGFRPPAGPGGGTLLFSAFTSLTTSRLLRVNVSPSGPVQLVPYDGVAISWGNGEFASLGFTFATA